MSYEKLGAEIGKLVETKQAAYGDSFGKAGSVMRILYPEGIPTGKLDDALTVVRVLDKLFRIATSRDALGESPWRDVAGYALLSVKRAGKDQRAWSANCSKCSKLALVNREGLCKDCFSDVDEAPKKPPVASDSWPGAPRSPPPRETDFCVQCKKPAVLNAVGYCHDCAMKPDLKWLRANVDKP